METYQYIETEKIRVFIAGSKNLAEKRKIIKALLSERNTEFDKNDENYCIFAYDYESMPEQIIGENGKQLVYNKFIEFVADIFIVILDDTVGGVTMEEFNEAKKALEKRLSSRSFPRPRILALGEKTKNELPIDIRNKIGDYYTDYISYSEAYEKIRGIIDGYVKTIKHRKSTDEKRDIDEIDNLLKRNYMTVIFTEPEYLVHNIDKQ